MVGGGGGGEEGVHDVGRKTGLFEELAAGGAVEFGIFAGAAHHEGFALGHIAGVAAQGDAPVGGRGDVIFAEDANFLDLFKGRFEGLHEARKVLGRVGHAEVIGGQFAGVDEEGVGLLEGDGEEAVEVLGGDAVELHVAAGVDEAEEAGAHGLDEFVGPGDGAGAAVGDFVDGEAGFLEDVDPLDGFLLFVFGDGAEAEGDEAAHGEFEAVVKFAVDLGVEHLGELATVESDGFLEVVAEGEHAQGDEDVEVFLGRQAEFVVALHLPEDLNFGAIGEGFGAADVELIDLAAVEAAFEDGERDRGEIFFFDGEVNQGGCLSFGARGHV